MIVRGQLELVTMIAKWLELSPVDIIDVIIDLMCCGISKRRIGSP
jgi:hypothetical protein